MAIGSCSATVRLGMSGLLLFVYALLTLWALELVVAVVAAAYVTRRERRR